MSCLLLQCDDVSCTWNPEQMRKNQKANVWKIKKTNPKAVMGPPGPGAGLKFAPPTMTMSKNSCVAFLLLMMDARITASSFLRKIAREMRADPSSGRIRSMCGCSVVTGPD